MSCCVGHPAATAPELQLIFVFACVSEVGSPEEAAWGPASGPVSRQPSHVNHGPPASTLLATTKRSHVCGLPP